MLAQIYERKLLIILLRFGVVRFGRGHMLSANQIAGFYSQPQVKNEVIN